jgi:hypothetical protein
MKSIAILDVCLPDYFTGYSKTVINVPIYSKTITCSEMASEIESEMNMLWELMEETHSPEEMQIWDNYIEEMKSKGEEIFYTDNEFIEIEDYEDYEPAYIYFGLINPVTSNGITFLNP